MSAEKSEPRADLAEQLVQAAVQAFSERGFHGTTTRDITSSIGKSPAALYLHYSTKEDLLFAISREGHEQVLAVLQDAVATSADPVEQLHAAVRAWVLHHVRTHTSARIVNYELAALSPEHAKQILDIRREVDETFAGLVQRGIDGGVFDTAFPRLAAVALESLGVDIARWYREGGWTEDEIAEAYIDMALRIVGARQIPQDPGAQWALLQS